MGSFNETVLITGASGFLGSNLSGRLVHKGAEVHAVSRVQRIPESGCMRWWQGDMADVETTRALLGKINPGVIIHLAGLSTASPERELVLPTLHSLLVSTVNLLVVAAEMHCRRIILAGSLTEPLPNRPESIPDSPYAAAKWASGGYVRMFHQLYDVPVVTVRPFMTYGPRQDKRKLIPHVILSLLKGEIPKLSSGQQEFDWIYVDDVVEGFLLATEAPGIEGRTIDLGSGALVSVRTVVENLTDLVGSTARPQFGALPNRPFEQARTADIGEAYAAMAWKPKTSLTEGLDRTVEWYSKRVVNVMGRSFQVRD